MLTNRFSPSTEAIRFQTLHHGQDKRAVQGCQGQDCRPTQGWNGLQDHRQAAWWEGDNNWCDYSQMEETQNNGQSPSVWSSMQDFTSWSFNDHKNGEKSATAATIVTKKTIDNTLRHEGLKSCSAHKVPLLKKAHVRPVWSLPMIQRRTGWKCCGQMRPKSSSLASTQLNSLCLEEEEMLPMTPRTPSPLSNMEVETLYFGGVC